MLRVLTVLGTRPEVIKLAPVVHALRERGGGIEVIVCSTGQHREMLVPLFDLLGIAPDISLDVMRRDQTLGDLTASLFATLGPVVREARPDWILAQGDTTTVLVASLLAHYGQIRFAHVEAGLRTGDLRQPFPEEMNRRVAGIVADLHFAPTAHAWQNLLNEGVPSGRILVTGNTVVDALARVATLPYDWRGGPLRAVPRDGRIVLVTAHRRESFGGGLREFCQAICEVAQCFAAAGVTFVYPVHLNPNVQAPVRKLLGEVRNVILLEPLDYLSFVNLLRRSTLVLTDSGGVQEEAPSFGVPLLVARDATERPEGVRMGVAKLVGTARERIVGEVSRLLTDPLAYAAMARRGNPYGDGRAAHRIAAALTRPAGWMSPETPPDRADSRDVAVPMAITTGRGESW
jgi:UDP-N-acetylglucosamine 2-epimerase (non-hydrolysing)